MPRDVLMGRWAPRSCRCVIPCTWGPSSGGSVAYHLVGLSSASKVLSAFTAVSSPAIGCMQA